MQVLRGEKTICVCVELFLLFLLIWRRGASPPCVEKITRTIGIVVRRGRALPPLCNGKSGLGAAEVGGEKAAALWGFFFTNSLTLEALRGSFICETQPVFPEAAQTGMGTEWAGGTSSPRNKQSLHSAAAVSVRPQCHWE